MLAVAALRHELLRLRSLAATMMHAALSGTEPREELEAQSDAVHALGEAISGFVAGVRTESMTRAVADELAEALFATRYLQGAARLAPHLLRLRQKAWRLPESPRRAALEESLHAAWNCLNLAARVEEEFGGDHVRAECLEKFESAYHRTKKTLLDATVNGEMTVQYADNLLDHLSAARRCVEQLIKGDRMLRSHSQAAVDGKSEGEGTTKVAEASSGATTA